MIVWAGIRSRRLGFAPTLACPAVAGLLVFVASPRLFAGGAYVDMRVLPSTVALALLAIRARPREERLERAGIAFAALRLATSTVALALFAREQQAVLAAVPSIPVGAAVLTLVNEPSPAWWDNPRLAHIAGIAVARRRAFTNEPWQIAGQQLQRGRHPNAAPYSRDPSQLVYPAGAPYAQTDFDRAVAGFDRGTFGFVWTMGFPVGRAHAADLRPVWHDDRSALYQVVQRNARLSPAPSRP